MPHLLTAYALPGQPSAAYVPRATEAAKASMSVVMSEGLRAARNAEVMDGGYLLSLPIIEDSVTMRPEGRMCGSSEVVRAMVPW